MDWAGLPRRSGRTAETIDDSISFMHLLTAKGLRGYTGPPARNETFLYGGCGLGAVRVGAYKAMLGQPAPSQYHMYCNTADPDTRQTWGTCVDVAAQNNTVKGGPLIFQVEHDPGERFPLRVNSSEYRRVLKDVNAAVARHTASMVALPQLLPHKVNGSSCCRDPAAAVCCRNSSTRSLPPCYCNKPSLTASQTAVTGSDTSKLKSDDADIRCSWTTDGKALDLKQWQRTASERTLPSGTVERNTTLSRDGTEALVEQRVFTQSSHATETLLRFKQSANRSSRLSAINTLDAVLPVPAGADATLHGFMGSAESATDYSATELPLAPAQQAVYVPVGGRSSNGVLPYFAVHFNSSTAAGQGFVFSVGWSGSWRVLVSRSADGQSVRVQAGLAFFNASLQSGQSFRGARILSVTYTEADDVYDGFNAHRSALAKHFLRHGRDGNVRGGLVSSWTAQTYHNDVSEQNMLAMIAGVKAAGVEAAWIDFGWYLGGGLGDVGNWVRPPSQSVDAVKFPHGLSTIADAAHAGSSRTSFIVWTEPERTAATAYLGPLPWSRGVRNGSFENFTIHEHITHRNSFLLLDLGNPEARQYMTAYLSEAVSSFGLDVLRMDFNIDPASSWSLKDREHAVATDGAVGLAEVAHVEGLYSMWSSVIEQHPDVLLDNCASGGRRIDLETASLSVALWQSDLAGNRGDVAESWQSQSMGLSSFLPVHSGGCPRFDSHTTSGPTGEAGLTTSVEPYVWRSCGTVGKAIAWTAEMWAELSTNQTLATGVRTAIAETQRMRRLVSEVDAKYWPLTPITPTAPWAAYEHLAANASTGFALVFRRPSKSSGGGGKLMRLVTNRSNFSWSLTGAAGTGYFEGKYYFTATSKAATTQDACQSACGADVSCSGFTFVPNGGPPCALYSTIVGPFRHTKSHVSQLAKVYDCGLPNCAFGFDEAVAKRHPLPISAASPFTVACTGSATSEYVPNCGTPTECAALSKAGEGLAGCPPYNDNSNASSAFELRLRGLRRDSSYTVQLYRDSYTQTDSKMMTGVELGNMTISLPYRSSLLLWFTAIGPSVE